MDNLPEHSAVEAHNEPQNQLVPPVGIEWGAIGLGLAAGVVWWIAQTVFWQFFYRYLATNYSTSAFSSSWFLVLSLVMRFAGPLAHGAVVGFAVGYRARFHAYSATTITMALLFLLTTCFSWFTISRLPIAASIFTASFLMWVVLAFILSIIGGLSGAYIAQSVKRNRGVQIQ